MEEQILLNEHEILVTSKRLVAHGTTYPLELVDEVDCVSEGRDFTLALLAGVMSAVFMLSALVLAFTARSAFGAFLLGGMSAILFAWSMICASGAPAMHALTLRSGRNQGVAARTTNVEQLGRVLKAIDLALAQRAHATVTRSAS